MSAAYRTRLFTGAATAVIAISASASPAWADCTTTGSAVSCTDTTGTTAVNTAVNAVAPPAVTLTVAQGATVTSDENNAIEPASTFVGAVALTNNGTIGSIAAPVGFGYNGAYDPSATADVNAANTLGLTNTGTITGTVSAFDIGGAINVANSGIMGGGLFLSSAGNLSLTNSGTIYNSNGGEAIDVSAGENGFEEATTLRVALAATPITNNAVIADASVTLDGAVATPATTGATPTAAVPQDVFVAATGNSTLSVNGLAGSVEADSFAENSVETPSSSTTSGTTTTTTSSFDSSSVGGNSLVTIGVAGQVSGAVAFSDAGSATVNVLGHVGTDTDPDAIVAGNVLAESFGGHTTSTDTDTVTTADAGNTTTSSATSATTALGGNATVDVANGAAVIGDVTALSGGGDAVVTIEGQVGSGSGRTIAASGNVLADAQSNDSTSNSVTTDSPTGSTTSNTTTAAVHGGNASVTIAPGADVYGSATAQGDLSATVDNAGRLHGGSSNLTASSDRSLVTATSNTSGSSTSTATDGTTTTISNPVGENFSSTTTSVGGNASAINRAAGVIDGGVTVAGLTGANFQNSGAVFGNVALSSTGNTSTTVNAETVTDITAGTATGTSSTSTALSTSSTSTATGGAVSGTYGGTIGALNNADNSGALPTFTSITQTADGASSATLSGTIYADFTGTAGGASSANSFCSNSSSITVPGTAPAPATTTTTQTSTSRSATTYAAADSDATVSGKLVDNGSGTGALALTSSAGNANLIVNGGSVTNATVSAAAQQNLSSGSDTSSVSVATANAAAVPQSSSTSSFSERDANTGAASATLTNAKLGSLSVSGIGTAPGSAGASATVDAKSVVSGAVDVAVAQSPASFGSGSFDTVNDRVDNSNVATRASDGTVTRTITSTETGTNAGGDATASVAGTVNSLSVTAPVGNATATLSGIATSGVQVLALGTNDTSSQITTETGSSKTTLSTPLTTENDTTQTQTVTGGNASLAINTATNLVAKNSYAISSGGIDIEALGNASRTIAAGSRVFQTGNIDDDAVALFAPNSSIQVGNQDLTNFSSTTTQSFDRNGPTTSTTHTTFTAVGGTGTFTNAGVVGTAAANNAFADIEALGGTTVTNSGKIYGSILSRSLGEDSDFTSTGTNLSDAVNETNTSVATITSVGGTASINNSGLVTGSVEANGVNGIIANSGAIENGGFLGSYVDDGTTTTTLNATSTTIAQTAPSTLFTQTYTFNQNALLLGGVSVAGAYVADSSTTPADPDHLVIKNTQINATINLNNGSVTLGNITGETLASNTGSLDPADTLVRATNTTLNLNGSGFLGVGPVVPPTLLTSQPNLESVISNLLGQTTTTYTYTPNFKQYLALDPSLGTVSTLGVFTPGTAVTFVNGSRIIGVENVDKTGDGTFTILGSSYLTPAGDNPNATYTMDVGTLKTSGGELQLGVTGSDPTTGLGIFGIRGNVENDAALMLGRSISFGSSTVIEGIAARVEGNFNQAASGTLEFGATPALIRQFGTLVLPAQAQGLLGYGQYGVTLSPFVPFGQQYIGLTSTPSSLTVTGNLSLAGKISVDATPGAIYLSGTGRDVFTVDGTFTDTATVSSGLGSSFVNFKLTPRSVNGATVVSLDVVRTPYASAVTTKNATAAANALNAAMPNVVSTISGLASPQAVTNVQSYGYTQDLATVMAALDSSLTTAQATQALNELGTGSFYGSLSAISTTKAFGDISDGLMSTGRGFGLWFRPVGTFAHFSGSDNSGADSLHVNNYGGSIGFNLITGSNGYFGIAGGYSHTQAHDIDSPESARANTYMVGIYGAQSWDNLHIGGQAVFGFSNWNAQRSLPFFDRTADSKFDSKEFRFTARAAYDFDLSGVTATPFVKLELRHYKYDGFAEQNAGGIGLLVDGASKTVFNPEIGGRVAASLGPVQPYAQASYVFQGSVGSKRTVAYLGDPETTFTLQGVNPKGYVNLEAGFQVDLGAATVFAGGNYLTGGHQQAGEIKGGVMIKF